MDPEIVKLCRELCSIDVNTASFETVKNIFAVYAHLFQQREVPHNSPLLVRLLILISKKCEEHTELFAAQQERAAAISRSEALGASLSEITRSEEVIAVDLKELQQKAAEEISQFNLDLSMVAEILQNAAQISAIDSSLPPHEQSTQLEAILMAINEQHETIVKENERAAYYEVLSNKNTIAARLEKNLHLEDGEILSNLSFFKKKYRKYTQIEANCSQYLKYLYHSVERPELEDYITLHRSILNSVVFNKNLLDKAITACEKKLIEHHLIEPNNVNKDNIDNLVAHYNGQINNAKRNAHPFLAKVGIYDLTPVSLLNFFPVSEEHSLDILKLEDIANFLDLRKQKYLHESKIHKLEVKINTAQKFIEIRDKHGNNKLEGDEIESNQGAHLIDETFGLLDASNIEKLIVISLKLPLIRKNNAIYQEINELEVLLKKIDIYTKEIDENPEDILNDKENIEKVVSNSQQNSALLEKMSLIYNKGNEISKNYAAIQQQMNIQDSLLLTQKELLAAKEKEDAILKQEIATNSTESIAETIMHIISTIQPSLALIDANRPGEEVLLDSNLAVDFGKFSNDISKLIELNSIISTKFPADTGFINWYKQLYGSILRFCPGKQEIGAQSIQLLNDIRIEILASPNVVSTALRNYQKFCPEPQQNWRKLIEVKLACAVPTPNSLNESLLKSKFPQTYSHYQTLQNHPKGNLLYQLLESLLVLHESNDSQAWRTALNWLDDPHFDLLGKHRKLGVIVEILAQICTYIKRYFFPQTTSNYRDSWFFLPTKTETLLRQDLAKLKEDDTQVIAST